MINYTRQTINNRQVLIPNEKSKKHLKEIKREIEGKYGIQHISRNDIIEQIIAFFLTRKNGDGYDYTSYERIDCVIYRTDIQKFFSSINTHKLYKKISSSNILSQTTVDLIKYINFSKKIKGIPLGFPPANALANIYLEDFEKNVKLLLQPNLYYRFVDDMIIIKYIKKDTKTDVYQMNNVMIKELEKLYLKLNDSKTETIILNFSKKFSDNPPSFKYLGYKFIFNNQLLITVEESKIKKINYNLKHLFYCYRCSDRDEKNFWVLYYRLKNLLYGVTTIDKNGNKRRFGLAYNYKRINDEICLFNILLNCEKEIRRCPISKRQKYILFSLLSVLENGVKVKYNKENSLNFLRNRFDYTRLSLRQKSQIAQRLDISSTQEINSSKIFYHLQFTSN